MQKASPSDASEQDISKIRKPKGWERASWSSRSWLISQQFSQTERALTYICILIRRAPIPSCWKSNHSIPLSNLPSNIRSRARFVCDSPKVIQVDKKCSSTIYPQQPRAANAVHHLAKSSMGFPGLTVPAPYLVNAESIFPKKMAAGSLKRAEAIVAK